MPADSACACAQEWEILPSYFEKLATDSRTVAEMQARAVSLATRTGNGVRTSTATLMQGGTCCSPVLPPSPRLLLVCDGGHSRTLLCALEGTLKTAPAANPHDEPRS